MLERIYRPNTATQQNAALRKDIIIEQSSISAFACVAVDKSTHDFSHEIGINDDERSRGSAWLLLFVAGQQQSVYRAATAKGIRGNVRRHPHHLCQFRAKNHALI